MALMTIIIVQTAIYEENFEVLTPGKTSSPTFCKICSISWTYRIKKRTVILGKIKQVPFLGNNRK